MDDQEIIALYLGRNEQAVKETEKKYNAYCFRIAKNILSSQEDAEECVNDTWVTAWNKIPPTIPTSLKAFLGKLVRDLSLSRYRENHAKKRYHGMDAILEELEECIPADLDVQKNLERQELSEHINDWLSTLPREDRVLFVKRYYYGETVKSLAALQGCTENQMAQRMRKLRNNLKAVLTMRGYAE
ncbi:MAG: sigma-70 family RNA polymerase sigma factor [Ruminiclostridium sp.]|nr:sigma-70 family RNA polymerase sigma factor [Ruminiclostridium sp.]